VRIDMVTPRFHPSVGGIEESVMQLATGLDRRGHSVTVHTMRIDDWPERERIQRIDVRRYPAVMDRGYYVSRFEPKLTGDIIHLHAYAHQTNDWVIRNRPGATPIFLSTHHGARFPKPKLQAKLYHAWYNRARGIPNLKRISGVLVPTAFDAEDFSARGVPRELLHVVPSGADERLFAPIEPWTPPGLDAGFVLYLGRLHEEKGVLDLLAAHALLPPNTPLVLAGRDEGILARLDRSSLGERGVHFLTDVTAEQRFGLLAACRLLVLPSHHEGQGIVVAEAWTQRKPVVATRAGALPSVIDDGTDGILVPVADAEKLAMAIQRVRGNPELAKGLGGAGRAKAEAQFRWPDIVSKVEQLYLASRNARRA
jgi:glycosyltransferase involved in cell wall biosynthesis